jgi:MarR family 2-MHQ and catechol resistance regulon transcriptional repressor
MATSHGGPEKERIALDSFVKLSRGLDTLASWIARENPFPRRLSTGKFGVLEALLHCGPMCQKEIGRKVLRSKGNTTTVVDHLEREGLVTRGGVKSDRRKRLVSLTPEGRRLISEYFPSHARAVTRAMGTLSRDEQLALGRLCRKLGLALASGMKTP